MKGKIPCINCILIAICRHKQFDDLLRDCDLIRNTLYWDKTTADGARSKYYGEKITMIRDILNPSIWDIDIDKSSFSYITAKNTKDAYIIDQIDSADHVIVPKGFKANK